ncbi:ATP-dependent DNA helicase Q-like 4B [Linum perenne]
MAANVEPGMWKEVTNFTWGIQNYSKPKPTELYSDTFLIMGYKWYGSVTLERICNRAPRTKTELLDMEGICKVNVTKYGDRLMQTIDVTIRNWCTEQGNGSNDKDASNYLSPKIQEVSKDSDDPEVIEPEVDLSSPCSSNVQLTSKNLLAELSTMASDCKFTSVDATNDASDGSAILQQEREKLSKFFEMSVEEICQANWFDNVQEVVLKISELASDSYEKTVLKNLLSRLVEFRNRIPGSLSIIKSSNDAETSSEQTRKELEGSLFKRQKQLTFLDSEVSRIEEERMKVKAEIELLVALEHKLVHEKNSTEAEMEVANREVSIELGVLKRKRTQHKEALENLLRAKESLAQANTSWKLFKENLGL